MADPRFYKNQGPVTLAEILEITGAEIRGATAVLTRVFSDVQTLNQATVKDIASFHNPKYQNDLQQSKAGLVFMKAEHAQDAPEDVISALTESPYRSFALIAARLYPTVAADQITQGTVRISDSAIIGKNVVIEPGAVIKDAVEIGDDSIISANAVVGKGVKIGRMCRIGPHASIQYALIGNDVVIGPGARIGQDGFGFFMDEKGHLSVPQLGRVIIEDGVAIGANTTIDRGTLEDTVIGFGTRIDNLVQIAHGVQIGRHCVIVSQVGISGSTHLGDFVIVAGQAGLTGHLNIGSKTRIAAQSGVMRDLEPGSVVAGSPAVPVYQWHRQTVALAQMSVKTKKESINDKDNANES